jgi:hypothetical protein
LPAFEIVFEIALDVAVSQSRKAEATALYSATEVAPVTLEEDSLDGAELLAFGVVGWVALASSTTLFSWIDEPVVFEWSGPAASDTEMEGRRYSRNRGNSYLLKD